MQDGIIGLHLLNKIDPDLIDMRTVNTGDKLKDYEVKENLNMFFVGCKGRINVAEFDAQAFLD